MSSAAVDHMIKQPKPYDKKLNKGTPPGKSPNADKKKD